jgi:hypothetical protein
MARQSSSRPTQSPIVEKLVADPSQPELRVLSGYLGRSARDGHWRVYQNVEFSEYLEVADSDIVHVEKTGRDDSDVAAWVWVRRDARVEHVRPQRTQAQAEFLMGDISSGFQPGAAGPIGALMRSLALAALPKTFSVTECATCPTSDGSHSCFAPVCTLATSCWTTHPADPGCGKKIA